MIRKILVWMYGEKLISDMERGNRRAYMFDPFTATLITAGLVSAGTVATGVTMAQSARASKKMPEIKPLPEVPKVEDAQAKAKAEAERRRRITLLSGGKTNITGDSLGSGPMVDGPKTLLGA